VVCHSTPASSKSSSFDLPEDSGRAHAGLFSLHYLRAGTSDRCHEASSHSPDTFV
jgi:hypothetical protein